MGMRKTLAKGIAYTVAPRTTFGVLNPRKAAYAKAGAWIANRVAPGRRRRNRVRNVTGLSAAALAVPIGIWLGRRFWSPTEPTLRHESSH